MANQSGSRRYTLSGDAAIEEHINKILADIVKELVLNIKPVSIFLSGSLAKEEMTAFAVDGKIEIVSDFEIGVLDWNWTKRSRVRKIEQFLAIKHGIDLTLLFFLPRRFKKGVPANWAPSQNHLTIEQYELIETSYFIYGRDFSKQCCSVDPSDIPLWEGLRLLFNRMAELVGVLTSEQHHDKAFYKACNKLLIASGDVLLLKINRYHPLYRERKNLLETYTDCVIDSCNGLSDNEFKTIIDAYNRKIYCTNEDLLLDKLISDTLRISDKIFKNIVSYLMNIEFSSSEQFSKLYLSHPDLHKYCKTNSRLANMASLLKNRARIKPISIIEFFKSVSIQHRIYADIYSWLIGRFKEEWEISGFACLRNEGLMLEGKSKFQNWKNFNI